MGIEAAIIGSALVSGVSGAIGADRAADAQTDANDAAIREQRRQFDAILDLTAPQRQVGNAALNTLASAFIPGFGGLVMGQPGPSTPTTARGPFRGNFGPFGQFGPAGFDPSQIPVNAGVETMTPVDANALSSIFRNLPGVEFAMNEAERGVGNSFASRGGAFSGNAIRALGDRQAAIASDRVFNNLFQLAGFGPQGNSVAAQGAANAGNNIAGLLSNSGAARASGFQGTASSINNAFQGGLANWILAEQMGRF